MEIFSAVRPISIHQLSSRLLTVIHRRRYWGGEERSKYFYLIHYIGTYSVLIIISSVRCIAKTFLALTGLGYIIIWTILLAVPRQNGRCALNPQFWKYLHPYNIWIDYNISCYFIYYITDCSTQYICIQYIYSIQVFNNQLSAIPRCTVKNFCGHRS